ncbi:hypothetical protein SSCG_01154 [Streptomyces clavuligerus]|nr:hypothetical protein SSCG_01154 [Streptomyces clavuligerus]
MNRVGRLGVCPGPCREGVRKVAYALVDGCRSVNGGWYAPPGSAPGAVPGPW